MSVVVFDGLMLSRFVEDGEAFGACVDKRFTALDEDGDGVLSRSEQVWRSLERTLVSCTYSLFFWLGLFLLWRSLERTLWELWACGCSDMQSINKKKAEQNSHNSAVSYPLWWNSTSSDLPHSSFTYNLNLNLDTLPQKHHQVEQLGCHYEDQDSPSVSP